MKRASGTNTTVDDKTAREQYHERIVSISQIVWEWAIPWLVVFPPQPPPPPSALYSPDSEPSRARWWSSWSRAAMALCRVGEALFPLVPRACRLLLGRSPRRSRDALEAAAEAGAPSCLRWMLRHRHHHDAHHPRRSSTSTTAATNRDDDAAAQGEDRDRDRDRDGGVGTWAWLRGCWERVREREQEREGVGT
ncbi:hypothetical protein Pelo_18095 [Pelomyxa schiedti]|nr:hypothetical protein Pelo_18095 [Pelomyxa schiedti]